MIVVRRAAQLLLTTEGKFKMLPETTQKVQITKGLWLENHTIQPDGANVFGENTQAVCRVYATDQPEGAANMRLIKAAPELLKALQMYVDQYSGSKSRENRPELRQARFALSIVKGNSK